MNEYVLPDAVKEILRPHLRRRLLLDTNVLLLLILANVDADRVGRGSLSKFEWVDFLALHLICESFSTLLTTPHILTEVCHLGSKDVDGPKRGLLYELLLKRYGDSTAEQSISLSSLGLPSLLRIGVADSVTEALCDGNTLLISDDRELCGIVGRRGNHAVNFNHVRDIILGS